MQYYLYIKNSDLTIMIETVHENKNETIYVNDFLNSTEFKLKLIMTSFVEYYDIVTKEQLQTPLLACEMILQSKLTFNRRIPLHEIKFSYSLDLSSNKKDLQKEIVNLLSQDKITVYYCDNTHDLCEAIIYHYSINGYYLKQCKNCGTLYFKRDKKGKYCVDCAPNITKEKNNQSANDYLSDPVNKQIHKIRSRLSLRTNSEKELARFNNEIVELKKELKNKIIDNKKYESKINELDQLYRKNKKGGADNE